MEVNYNDGKWHGWNGGECPVHPQSVVEVQWNNERDTRKANDYGDLWHNSDGDEHFAAFRVVKEYKDPREFWVSRMTQFDLNGNVCGHVFVESSEKDGEFKVREVIE